MKTTSKTLRKMVTDNRWTASRLSEAQLGSKDDYNEMSKLYTDALEVLTNWASKDYAHISTTKDKNCAFASVKAILSLYATDEDRVIIDEASLRTLRDLSTSPKRIYSIEYTKAMKLKKMAEATLSERATDLATIGITMPEEDENFDLEVWVKSVRDGDISVIVGNVNMLDMYLAARSTLAVREKSIADIKAKGNYTWTRPQPTTITKFAELVENYVGDCLEDGFNLKSYKDTIKSNKERNDALKSEIANA